MERGPLPLSSPKVNLPQHVAYVQWAQETKGVQLNGIEPAVFAGKGLGIVATRHVKAGEVLVRLPVTALCTVEPEEKKASIPMSVHGRLASRFVPGLQSEMDAAGLQVWLDSMPALENMQPSFPHLWPADVVDKLPFAAAARFEISKKNFDRDLRTAIARAAAANAKVNKQKLTKDFTRAWLLVNSRSFYWNYPVTLKDGQPPRKRPMKKRDRDDCLALCPFADYFNHANEDDACPVEFDETEYKVTAYKAYSPGEEITVSYGTHSNDYLLVEYGFTMFEGQNKSDSLRIDDVILPRLTAAHKKQLQDENLLGQYTLDSVSLEVCHRTQCAVRITILPSRQWERYVKGMSDGAKEQAQVDGLLGSWLAELEVKTRTDHEKLLAMASSSPSSPSSSDGQGGEAAGNLARRVGEVRGVLTRTMEKLKSQS